MIPPRAWPVIKLALLGAFILFTILPLVQMTVLSFTATLAQDDLSLIRGLPDLYHPRRAIRPPSDTFQKVLQPGVFRNDLHDRAGRLIQQRAGHCYPPLGWRLGALNCSASSYRLQSQKDGA